jgi:hypothetical protein
VKRLANVTQLCKCCRWHTIFSHTHSSCRLPRLLLRSSHLRTHTSEPS